MTGQRKSEGFFGRRHGKALRARQAEAMAAILPRYAIDLTQPAPQQLGELFAAPVERVCLEIGFGGGEHLLHRVRNEPNTGFIGVEPFVNGMAKLISAVATEPPANLRVHNDEAAGLLEWLPEASIAGLDLLYPDPWPKRRHWKRRFVSAENLNRLARVLQPGALFRVASDIDSYVNWTLLRVLAHPDFEWTASSADDWRLPFPGWPGTRYEAKAIAAGRKGTYLTFRRR